MLQNTWKQASGHHGAPKTRITKEANKIVELNIVMCKFIHFWSLLDSTTGSPNDEGFFPSFNLLFHSNYQMILFSS